jgi:cystinosin
MASFLEILSQIFGWVYTTSWSLSFYPQPLLNFRRKSTSGTTIDFPLINVLGFLAYFTSNVAFLYSPVIREQYALRNHGLTPTVEFNDLAFAGHAVILSILTYTQFFPWIWGFDKRGRKGSGATVSKGVMGIFIGCITGVVITAIIVGSSPREDVRKGWAWIDVVGVTSYECALEQFTKLYFRSMPYPTSKSWSPSLNTCLKSLPTSETAPPTAGQSNRSSWTSLVAYFRSRS